MSNVKNPKPKLKRYFVKNHNNKRRTVDINLKGFLCSCNNREKDCIKEAYNLLNLYADKLYGSPDTVQTSEETEDIDEMLNKELSELKKENTKSHKFQVVESGAKNFLFIRTTLENPVELAEKIVQDINETGSQKTKFLLRLIPVEVTCKSYPNDIVKAAGPFIDKYFKDSAQKFSVIFNHRNNNTVSRDEVIKLLADRVFETRSDHVVNLKEAEISIIVEVIKGFAFISVIPNYLKFKKYNLLAISDQTSAQAAESTST